MARMWPDSPTSERTARIADLRFQISNGTGQTVASSAPAAGRVYVLRCVILLSVITLLTHGLSLFDGVVLDDFWHQKGLREHGWAFSDLLRTLDITPADFQESWWQTKDVQFQYFRPFFIVCMKFVYGVLGRNDPMFLHGFSILLHWVSTLMVWWLCWKLTRHKAWSFFGGLMFAIYPHSIVTVAWPSSQNVVIQNTLLLAMLLSYIRASSLSVGPETWNHARPMMNSRQPLDRPYLALTIVFWLMAILTRENAILFPAILLSLDLVFGGIRRAWSRRWLYVFFGVVSVAFMACRELARIAPLPDVYCRRPDGDLGEYVPWLLAKILHYVCVSIWPAPLTIGPTGRFNPWADCLGDCLFMLGIVIALGVVYFLATRRAPGWWIWPLWMLLSILPVAAVVATPHSGYMSGVGFAVGLTLAGAVACAVGSTLVRRVTLGLTVILFLGQAFMSPVNRLQWIAIYSAERYLHSWVMVAPPSREVRDVFFINPPFVNVYCKPNMVSRLGPWFEEVRVHVLAYAPKGLMMTERTILDQLDDYSFTLEIKENAYFSGAMGRLLLEAFRGRELFRAGQVVKGKAFDVEILEADEQGVWKLKFTFPRRLSDPTYCFYLTSQNCGAARIRFMDESTAEARQVPSGEAQKRILTPSYQDTQAYAEPLSGGHAAAALPLFERAISEEPVAAKRADMALRPMVAYMANVLGSPVQPLLDQPELSGDEWRRVRDWWQRWVDDRTLAETWLHRRDFFHLVYLRAEIDWDRWLASFVFQTDLYMTGLPYDNPREPKQAGNR